MVPAKFTPEQRHDPNHTARFRVYMELNWPGGGLDVNARMLNRASIVAGVRVLVAASHPEYSQSNTEYREMAVSPYTLVPCKLPPNSSPNWASGFLNVFFSFRLFSSLSLSFFSLFSIGAGHGPSSSHALSVCDLHSRLSSLSVSSSLHHISHILSISTQRSIRPRFFPVCRS